MRQDPVIAVRDLVQSRWRFHGLVAFHVIAMVLALVGKLLETDMFWGLLFILTGSGISYLLMLRRLFLRLRPTADGRSIEASRR